MEAKYVHEDSDLKSGTDSEEFTSASSASEIETPDDGTDTVKAELIVTIGEGSEK